jgi:hypothetical protein
MARAFARQRFRLVFRSLSTAYPQGRFSGCVSVYMGLLSNRSQAQKNPRVETRVETTGQSSDRAVTFRTVRDPQKAFRSRQEPLIASAAGHACDQPGLFPGFSFSAVLSFSRPASIAAISSLI